MRRHLPLVLAAILALVATALLAYQWLGQPTTLRVAVGPAGSEDARLMAAVAQSLARTHEEVRLRLVPTSGVAESARMAEIGRADLAVVRSDVGIPASTQTVAILHRDAALLLATDPSLSAVPDLRGKRIGIVRNPAANLRLLASLLAHYDVPADAVTTVPLGDGQEAGEALREGKVDAVLTVSPLIGRTAGDVVASIGRTGGTPAFVPIGEAAVLARRWPALESVEIARGTFGGTPPRPAETVTTVGVSHRLVAQARLADSVVSELTRLLFVIRPALAVEVPLANQIEAPETSKSASLPVHPGAQAYYEGEVESFFERYGDWFYLLVMCVSILGSAAATLVSRAANRSRARDMALLRQLLAIVRASRDVEDELELSDLERQADEILAAALARAGTGAIDNAGVAAFTLGLDQARRAIAERRAVLVERHAAGPDPLSAAAE
ncbi:MULTISPECIES: TAXI family TRAP transporter solute-binding subunit [Methylobacterium]|jgi:TRAP transporter TAXI family solute receptor|uniref:TAXI family TRAP transporter solute-binding subunit n=1 Tax=Methylobacterium TaxID=407 RepID=UPI0008E2E108|nr:MULTISPECIES: TAXI family TRAP transporter solute-binding subunit [Methylobacterium]MBK3395804.1 ABC transporter substrate-binding protein [Methylobacterium ajmalii]MBK3411460.1 ABC transporter substrate-binding protein [Methylobacterium ajmalii]MBK3424154.1 ABC transporter substrate-binding protein [Methylobacterium ajmalii]MBZ6412115.1 ABC transporter substrate-binding protein [Methylobacterium sp.]SFF11640.1 TRAP transporter solute receptor, TAXI family [Methylobacterium sp. yr596]